MMTLDTRTGVDFSTFTIGFDDRDRGRLHQLWDSVIDSQRWSEGLLLDQFESSWSKLNGATSVAFSSWAGGALAALEYAEVRGEDVLCPSNTFMASPLSIIKAGGNPRFVDCNRDDLCISFKDFEQKAEKYRPKAAMIVHIGGHIAFEIERIAEYCKQNDIFLIEDCAHAHGSHWQGRRPGTWGDAGVYSLYATKTISTGEGGILVSQNEALIEFAHKYRNYGKSEYTVMGLNYRMSEFIAAIGIVQVERLEEIVSWKNKVATEQLDDRFPSHLKLPDGMVSGLYKYIVFDPIDNSTGKVYDQPCHRILNYPEQLPNSDWVADNHWCVPLYYHGAYQPEKQNQIQTTEESLL